MRILIAERTTDGPSFLNFVKKKEALMKEKLCLEWKKNWERKTVTSTKILSLMVIIWRVLGIESKVGYHIYLVRVNNRKTRKRCKICLKLTIKTPERRSTVFIVNFGHI